MSATRFEAFLARIYVDQNARVAFLDDPRGAAAKAGLTTAEVEELNKIDRIGLELMANSLAHKRRRRGVALHEGRPGGRSAAGNQTAWRTALAKLAALVEKR